METEITTAYVGLGSNLGDRAGNLLMAVRGLLEASFVVTKLSAIYETEPVDIDTPHRFLNMAAELRIFNITPSQVMARLLRIEYLLGRGERTGKKPRTVDLDLLFYGRTHMETPFLTLPHPRLHLRRFVLTPMAELAPNLVHPVLHKEMRELLRDVDDPTHVARWNPNSAERLIHISSN